MSTPPTILRRYRSLQSAIEVLHAAGYQRVDMTRIWQCATPLPGQPARVRVRLGSYGEPVSYPVPCSIAPEFDGNPNGGSAA